MTPTEQTVLIALCITWASITFLVGVLSFARKLARRKPR